MQISFYHLTKTNVEEALPKLLEKVLETENKSIVLCNEESKVKLIDGVLWSVGGARFIPHATANDNDIEHHPIFVTAQKENPINANFLVDLNLDNSDFYKDFQRTMLIFSGSNESELRQARSLWKKFKTDPAAELKYFQQNEKGNWEEKKDKGLA
jgi:DNA polymerase-3 subunit chi